MKKIIVLLTVLCCFAKGHAQERNAITAGPKADSARKFIMSKDAPVKKPHKMVVKETTTQTAIKRDN